MGTQPKSLLQFLNRDAQMSFEWESPVVIQRKPADDEIALCRWEDDGGTAGKDDADGE